MARNKTINEKIAAVKAKKEQYEKQMKALEQQQKVQERNARTKRLIERGAILEKQIEEAETLTNDQIKLFLEMTLHTDEAREALALVIEQPDVLAPEKAAEKPQATTQGNGGADAPKPVGAAHDGGTGASGNGGGGARQGG